MPINILYCEGNSKSIDIRVIRQLLPKECIVHPLGGKTRSFFDSVINDRRINPNLAGIMTFDFIRIPLYTFTDKFPLNRVIRFMCS